LTLLPFTALILYQRVPVAALPAHLVDHAVPVTVALTSTLVSVLMRVLAVAVVEGLVRRRALHAAYLVTATDLNRLVGAYR
jgi:hypothetical protein